MHSSRLIWNWFWIPSSRAFEWCSLYLGTYSWIYTWLVQWHWCPCLRCSTKLRYCFRGVVKAFSWCDSQVNCNQRWRIYGVAGCCSRSPSSLYPLPLASPPDQGLRVFDSTSSRVACWNYTQQAHRQWIFSAFHRQFVTLEIWWLILWRIFKNAKK